MIVGDLGALAIADDDLRHLTKALRLRPGDPCTATNGAGAWRPARVTASGLAADGPIVTCAPRRPALTVAMALTKGAKPELAVQKLTELGIDTIVVFGAAHSVARWDTDKAAKNQARFERIAHEAVMQSRGVWLPAVRVHASDDAFVLPAGAVRADRDGVPLGPTHQVVAIGPEGGWSDDERAHLGSAVRLSDQVLRAETAAIAAGALMAAHRSHATAG